jgi:hypothetical protein
LKPKGGLGTQAAFLLASLWIWSERLGNCIGLSSCRCSDFALQWGAFQARIRRAFEDTAMHEFDELLKVAEPRALDAEIRVNLVRVAAISLFYLVHLWHAAGDKLGPTLSSLIGVEGPSTVSGQQHLAITMICMSWLLMALGVQTLISIGRASDGLTVLWTIGDIVFLTAVLCVSTGPKGPMVIGYFLIIMLTGLRFNLRLVRVGTACAIAGYLFLLASVRWPVGLVSDLRIESVPRYHQMMVVIALLIAGVIVGQIVRHAYAMSMAPSTTVAQR